MNCLFFHCFAIILSVINANLIHIAIFSSPENFERRHAIRRTWLKNANKWDQVKVFFVIGNSTCSIPPNLRLDFYGCNVLGKKGQDDLVLSTTAEEDFPPIGVAQGFGFVANRPITIKQLGIPPCLGSQLYSDVIIKLIDAYDHTILASAVFKRGTSDFEKRIHSVQFGSGAEGFLIIEGSSKALKGCKCVRKKWRAHNAPISFTSIYIEKRWKPFDLRYSPCGYMRYMIQDVPDSVNDSMVWQDHVFNVYNHLHDEIETYKDILLLNITDSYANLPNKLLQLFVYLTDNEDFEYLLKTDDDSIIDVPRITRELCTISHQNLLWWWSYFNEYRAVPLVGKWRELNYQSATYPPFPCGGGYVLSRRLVNLLSKLAPSLRTLRGEDVSLGVWLAGLNTIRHSGFAAAPSYKSVMLNYSEPLCNWSCGSDVPYPACNRVQVASKNMYSIWEHWKETGVL